jgi:DNA modification methylase
MMNVQTTPAATQVELWHIDRLVQYARNPRRNDAAVDRMCPSIVEFGFKIPVLARSSGEVVDGHLRLKAARKLGITEIPVILCDEWSDAQVKAFRLLVNRSATWADFDEDLLALEMQDLQTTDFDLSLTGFDSREIDELLTIADEKHEDSVPPLPAVAVSRVSDLWLLGKHRVLSGDATSAEDVARLLGGRKPRLMVSDAPYGISLDSEWRDRAGLNPHGTAEPSYMKKRTKGHTETSISGDTRADWSEAFALVPSLEVLYVWYASSKTVDVLTGLERIGFSIKQQIIWVKTVAALSRQSYHWKHEPAAYAVRNGKTTGWIGSRDQTTVWEAASPKAIMGGSDEEKLDHPTQKPVELMRRPILNHIKRGDLVYDGFLGSGTTLAAAELTQRVCYGLELDPKYIDVIIQRWQSLSSKEATLDGDGRTFAQVAEERLKEVS